jgi:abortive infection bacteriophage resistance protein
MKYSKPPLTFEEQAKLLISRGLIVDDPKELINYLTQVNYYRLSGYWYNLKIIDPSTGIESFKNGTTFNKIRERYEFDRKLRLLMMDAIERIEVAIFRTRLVETHTLWYDPFGYSLRNNYSPKFSSESFNKLLSDITEDENRSNEEFIIRYRSKYSGEKYLPLWMVTELMSFGQLLTLFRNQHLSFKQEISRQFLIFPPVLDSWLLTLNTIRNSCAHHARIWNRPLPLPIKIPDKKHDPRWYNPVPMSNNSVFSICTVIHYLLKFIVPSNQWRLLLKELLDAYPDIPLLPMGFPNNWEEYPLWK